MGAMIAESAGPCLIRPPTYQSASCDRPAYPSPANSGIAGLPQRLVGVHAAAVIAEDRLGHERDRLALAVGHVLHDVFVEQHLVGGAHQRVELQVDFGLTS